MIKELFENISAGQDIRKSLIALKQELKQEEARIELLALLQGDFSLITELLNDPDPKVRKNAAMTLGRTRINMYRYCIKLIREKSSFL